MRDAAHTAPIAPGTIPLPGLLEIAGEAMLAEFREELAKNGYEDLRPTHGCVFRFVREDGMRLTELAAHGGITKQSAGELVDDLVELGYVERIADPADKRAKLICLTERGREPSGSASASSARSSSAGPSTSAPSASRHCASCSSRSPPSAPPPPYPELSQAALAGSRGE